MGSRFKIGVDGGGTKTEFIVVDETGAAVARHLSTGCNPNVGGVETARSTVLEGLAAVLAQAGAPNGPVTHTLLCMSGAPTFWREFADVLPGFGRVSAIDDSVPVLELATEGEPGLVLHAGTGSFAAARDREGAVHYAGGLGWRFGDPASAYDLGRRAVSRALLELQGWLPTTAFSELVRRHTQLDEIAAITRHFYQSADANRQNATLAPAVLQLAGEGDATALAIVVESCLPLLDLGRQVAAKLFAGFPPDRIRAGLSGILSQPLVLASLSPHFTLPFRPITAPPIEGVRRLLQKIGG
jgi:glucosamine kinase